MRWSFTLCRRDNLIGVSRLACPVRVKRSSSAATKVEWPGIGRSAHSGILLPLPMRGPKGLHSHRRVSRPRMRAKLASSAAAKVEWPGIGRSVPSGIQCDLGTLLWVNERNKLLNISLEICKWEHGWFHRPSSQNTRYKFLDQWVNMPSSEKKRDKRHADGPVWKAP